MAKCLRPVIVALLVIAVAAPANAAVDDTAKLPEARAIIEIMFPPAERQQTFDKLIDQFTAQYRASIPADAMDDPGLKAVVERYFDKFREQERPLIQRHLPEVFEATAIAYTHEFSLGELKEIHAFAMTPTGRHYLSRSAKLLSDPTVAKANTSTLAETQQLVKSMVPQMTEEIVDYLKAHPDVAAKINAANKGK